MNVEERIGAARTFLAGKIPFLGFLALRMNPQPAHPKHGVDTMGISADGTLYYNEAFVEKLSKQELRFVLCHEVLHPALLCFERLLGKDFALWNCFPRGALVSGAWEPLEKLSLGSRLLTRSGMSRASENLHAREYAGPLVTVKAMGLEPLISTPEHEVLAFRRLNMGHYPIRMSENAEWIEVKNLRAKEHYLCVPRLKGTFTGGSLDLRKYAKEGRWGEGDTAHNCRRFDFPLTKETAWLLGLYVAEGGTHGESVRFTLCGDEIDLAGRIKEIGGSLGYATAESFFEDRNGMRISIGSSLLSRMFEEVAGNGSKNKRIPDCILFHENEHLLRSFLQGYQEGDGWQGPQGSWEAGTACKVLALQIQLAWARLGRLAKLYMRPQKDRSIRGIFIQGGAPFWWISVHEGLASQRDMNGRKVRCTSHRWRKMEEFILTPILEVTEADFVGKVYNIATPDHTYVISNALVHNCAHDYAINQIIMEFCANPMLKGLIQMPSDGLLADEFKNMSAEEIYEDLLKNAKKVRVWCLSGDVRPDLSSSSDGKSAAQGDQSAQSRLQRAWQIAVAGAAQAHEEQMGRGSLPGGLRILINEMLEPKIAWTDLLSRWLGETAGAPELTYMRPSRRSEAAGEILIGRKKTFYPEVTVLWDTSGSMAGEEKKIFPEVGHMCEELDFRLRVMIIDADIHADLEDVEDAQEIAEAVAGGGGSDFCPAFVRLDEEGNDSVVIAFTDGFIGVPKTQPETLKGVLWVLTDGGIDPTRGKWGQVLRLDSKKENGTWE